MDSIDAVVIGAGVVGLAVARAIAQTGRECVVLEAEGAVGTGVSSRSSEVIHAGLYYPGGSLKARLCVAGKHALYAYCRERGVEHRALGKLVVATQPAQLDALRGVQAQAAANGVPDLEWLERDALRELEPQLAAHAALRSPSTGIVDTHGLMLALQGDLEHAGGAVAFASAVERVLPGAGPQGRHVVMAAGTELAAEVVVNAAGLGALALARACGAKAAGYALPAPPAQLAKGNYFSLAGKAPFSRLIYPLPEAGGLGVHLTLDLAGRARFGPDVQWIDAHEPIDWRVDPARAASFESAIRRWWPGLPEGALQPDYSGVRPKLGGPEAPSQDFRIDGPAAHGWPGLVHLLGIESPGLTSCLAIGAHVAALL
ncbi:NAD(P)/FAD-dependent oxidoreductase [Caldimonas sp. KR1-144]|uniref:NAD(P)/FAD-dependent oxidoreductase n=1 Tax=Caldimonas sp. KR1-144 TaxID=3400911 RepID=UPI003C019352